MKIKYIDLFCGIGGFRLAIEKYNKNFECILSIDCKKDAIDVYNLNFKENNIPTKIEDINIKSIPSFDLLCAGFPCQPFSSAGKKNGFNDTRGGMIFYILDIVKIHKPKTIILENVSNLITLEKGKYLKEIIKMFEELKYNVDYIKLNSSNFNCPQFRERVYIICTLTKKIDLLNIEINNSKKLKDIIDYEDKKTDIDNNFVNKLLEIHNKSPIYGYKLDDKRGGDNNIHSWDIEFNGAISKEEKKLMNLLLLERRKKHWAIKKKIKWMDGMPLTFEEILTFYKNENLKNMLDNLVEKNYLRKEKCKDLIDGKRQYKEDSIEGYNICKGKLSFPISRILDPNNISPTLTATDSNKLGVIIDSQYIRKLNKNELKKICGFPDTFIIPDNVNYYDLFGNMVCPPVIYSLLKLIYG